MPSQIHHYGDHKRQVIADYTPQITSNHGLVFIHGGLWRDPNNTYKDWQGFAQGVIEKDTFGDKFKVYSLDYRVDLEVKHPGHLLDVASLLEWIKVNHQTDELTLVGHSCGATLIVQLLNFKEITGEEVKFGEIRKIALLDGIYDIASFVEEYPVCESLILESFLSTSNTTALNIREPVLENWVKFARPILIVQSTTDELLSMKQTELLVEWLESLHPTTKPDYKLITQDFGLHNEVYINDYVLKLILTSLF